MRGIWRILLLMMAGNSVGNYVETYVKFAVWLEDLKIIVY